MKVNVLGLLFAAQRLVSAAEKLRAITPPVLQPLAADGTSLGAAGRLDAASAAVWSSTCAQATSLETAASHLVMIAARFGSREEINRANLATLSIGLSGMDEGALSALAPVPPLAPDVRPPLPPMTPEGELFSQLVTARLSASAGDFTTSATTAAATLQSAALTLRSVSASIPDYWDSPVGTPALTGRTNEHAAALDAISEQWSDLGGQASRHGQQYEETVAAVPKPKEFKDNETALRNAQANNANGQNTLLISQLIRERGELLQRALTTALRYHGETEATTGHPGAGPAQPPGAGGGGASGGGVGGAGRPAGLPQQAQLAKAGAGEAGQAGQAGEGAGQLAQMLPAALGAIGGMAGGMAGMAGQVPQALMQSGQGLAQAATQGMSGLASKKEADAELAKYAGGLNPEEPSKADGGGGAGGGGAGDTHPACALGPPVTPSTSHTAPTMPAGAAPPPTTPAPAGSSAMGGMGMGMPMGGMMPHGAGGGNGADKVPADKKVVTPPQPHTEPVTGKVSDRTAAAAEASRTRTDSGADDDPPPRGPVLRRITLAPLNDERA